MINRARTNVLGQSQPTLIKHLICLLGTPTRAHGSSIAGRIVLLFLELNVRRVRGNEHGATGFASTVCGTGEGTGEGTGSAIVRGGFVI